MGNEQFFCYFVVVVVFSRGGIIISGQDMAGLLMISVLVSEQSSSKKSSQFRGQDGFQMLLLLQDASLTSQRMSLMGLRSVIILLRVQSDCRLRIVTSLCLQL